MGAAQQGHLGASGSPSARSLFYLLTSAVNVSAVAVIGIPMWLGVLPGSQRPLITLLPAAAALATIVGTLAAAGWARRAAPRRSSEQGRTVVALAALGGRSAGRGADDPRPRLAAARGGRLLALRHLVLLRLPLRVRAHAAVLGGAMAYLVGMLANSLPIPGGFVAVEGGLVGMLLLFGERPASLVLAAVITYRAIALWVPSMIGTVAFLSMRSEIGKPLRPQPGAPSAVASLSRTVPGRPRAWRRRAGRRARGGGAGWPSRRRAGARRGRGSTRAGVAARWRSRVR